MVNKFFNFTRVIGMSVVLFIELNEYLAQLIKSPVRSQLPALLLSIPRTKSRMHFKIIFQNNAQKKRFFNRTFQLQIYGILLLFEIYFFGDAIKGNERKKIKCRNENDELCSFTETKRILCDFNKITITVFNFFLLYRFTASEIKLFVSRQKYPLEQTRWLRNLINRIRVHSAIPTFYTPGL